MVMEKPKSVADYFKKLPPEQREPLRKLRDTIAAAAPEAEEGITYSMPGFLLGGKGLSRTPRPRTTTASAMSGLAVAAHQNELGERVTARGRSSSSTPSGSRPPW